MPVPAITVGPTWTDNTDGSATVTWTTDIASDSYVDYGPSASYGSNTGSASQVTSHSVTVSGLSVGTTYHFRASSTAAGQTVRSSDGTGTVTNIFFLDNFTGTDGTLLTAHTPDVGSGWAKGSASGGGGDTMEIINNAGSGYARNTTGASGYASYFSTADSPSLYQKVTAALHINATGGPWGFGFQGQSNQDPNAGGNGSIMMAGLFRDDGITRITSSVKTDILGGTPSLTYSAGNDVTATLKYDGKITMTINKGGADVTQVVKRNDLMRHIQTNPGVAWGGKGKIWIMANGAGGGYGATTQWYNSVKGERVAPNASYKMVGFFGDSIVRGVGTSDVNHQYYATCWPQQWLDLQSDANVVMSNCAIQAQTAAQMGDNTTGDIPLAAALFNSAFAKNIVVCHAGGNDIASNGDNVAASTAYTRLTTWLTNMRAACPAGTKFVIVKVLPRTTASFNGSGTKGRDTLNTAIAGNAAGFDAIVTPSASIFDDSAASDVAKYGDGVHPTDSACATLAADVKAVTDVLI